MMGWADRRAAGAGMERPGGGEIRDAVAGLSQMGPNRACRGHGGHLTAAAPAHTGVGRDYGLAQDLETHRIHARGVSEK